MVPSKHFDYYEQTVEDYITKSEPKLSFLSHIKTIEKHKKILNTKFCVRTPRNSKVI